MSGSGGGGYVSPQRNEFDCDNGFIETNVSSINIDALKKRKIADILDVVIGENNELLLEDGDGEFLGAILHPNTSDLIKCIKTGVGYSAKIQNISIPVCEVKIYQK